MYSNYKGLGRMKLFFFQAEDGIRDVAVTGVQTCALPICIRSADRRAGGVLWRDSRPGSAWPGSPAADRKSGVEGKGVDIGGGRISNKKRKKGVEAKGWISISTSFTSSSGLGLYRKSVIVI